MHDNYSNGEFKQKSATDYELVLANTWWLPTITSRQKLIPFHQTNKHFCFDCTRETFPQNYYPFHCRCSVSLCAFPIFHGCYRCDFSHQSGTTLWRFYAFHVSRIRGNFLLDCDNSNANFSSKEISLLNLLFI